MGNRIVEFHPDKISKTFLFKERIPLYVGQSSNSKADVVCFFRIATQAINHFAFYDELPDMKKDLYFLEPTSHFTSRGIG